MMETLWRDARYAARSLRRAPGFTMTVVLTLALGIGAGTAVFSVVDGVLLRPLPYPDPDRLVRLAEGYQGAAPLRPGARLGNVTYHAWKDAGMKTVGALDAFTESDDALVEIDGGRTLIPFARVTPGLLTLLGASPAAGRMFTDADAADSSEPVVILSEGLWRERFGGDAAVVGRSLRVAGQSYRVIGVTGRGFAFPDRKARLWSVLTIPRPTGPPQNPRFTTFFAVARLKPGATSAQAAAEATGIARSINPKPLAARITFGAGGAAFVDVTPMLNEMTSGVAAALVVVAAGIACILLIVCVTVANLLLSRGAARHRELAVRNALGAGWPALARQFVAESLVLSLCGGAAGVVLAYWIVGAVPFLAPADFPRLENVRIDYRVFTAAVSVSLLTGLLAALAPIVGVVRVDLAHAFRSEGTGGAVARVSGDRTRSLLLAAQSAFTVVLLVVSVLLGRSFVRLIQVDAGYSRDGVVIADVLRPDTTQESAQRYAPLMHDVLERLRSQPKITAAAIASMSPLDRNTSLQGFPVPGSLAGTGAAPRTAMTRSYAVTPGYEAAIGLRLKAGRFLVDADAAGDDARWVVNEEFARLYLPPNPVGRRFPWRRGNQNVQLEIVGVVGNVLKDGNAATPSPEIYRILRSTEPFFNYQIVARTNGDANAVTSVVRAAVRDIAPDATVNLVGLSQRFSDSVAQPRLATTVFGALALLAAGLTALGMFAALSYSLSQRAREFGVRVALGATRLHLVRLVARQGMAPAAIGVVAGMTAAAGATRFIQGVLFGVSPLDAVSFAAAPLLLGPVALLACLLPAIRASRVDPMVSLRAE